MTVSYIDSSRRFCLRRRRKDVYHRWASDRVWRERQRGVRLDLLDYNIVLKKRRKLRRFLFRIFQYVFLQKELNSSAKAQTRKIYRHIRQRESAHTVIERFQQFRCQMKIDHRG